MLPRAYDASRHVYVPDDTVTDSVKSAWTIYSITFHAISRFTLGVTCHCFTGA
jgi:hypothetical protein